MPWALASRRKRRARLILAIAAALLAAGLAAYRPWADSVMAATITLTTDETGIVAERSIHRLFRAGARGGPVVSVALDLSEWEGRLVRLDVSGLVSRRGLGGDTGYVACAAELRDVEGERPLDFIGWQDGMRRGLHPHAIGPRACRLGSGETDRFAFATKGGLWHVLRVPRDASLRVSVRPVLALQLEGPPKPCLPANSSASSATVGARLRQVDRPPDVFIYVIDALRADHLGCYGYGRDTSPVIDSFASEATLYEHAYTPATWTRPSMATALTGLYPSAHRTMHMGDGLAEWPVLLSEILRDAGYVTRCISANENVSQRLGFDQGYDEFAFIPWTTAGFLNGMLRRRLAGEDADQPVFALVHTMEPHGPYTPSPESFRRFDRGIEGSCDGSTTALNALTYVHPDLSDDDFQHLIDLYDAEVYEADHGFVSFLEALKRTGRYESSLIIVISDHGEAFGEHDTRAHGFDLSQETMEVTLVVRFPHGRLGGQRVKRRVSLIDVVPTVLAETGVRARLPYALPGESLSRPGPDSSPGAGRLVFGEVARCDGNALDLVGVIDEDGYKRVIDVSAPPREAAARRSLGLWDKNRDPTEQADLASRMPVRAAYGEQLVARWLSEQLLWVDHTAAGEPPKVELSAEALRDLEALGYLGGAGRQ